MKYGNPRAQLFFDRFGYFKGTDYINWIGRHVDRYKRERGLCVVEDHDDFTEYLRSEEG